MSALTPLPLGSRALVQDLLDEVRGIQDAVAARFGPLTPDQLRWSPGAGSWGVGECLDHLLRTNELYLAEVEPAVDSLEPVPDAEGLLIRGSLFGRWFTRAVGPDSRWKVPAPRRFRAGGGGSEPKPVPHDVVDRFLAQHDRIRSVVRRAEGRPLDRIRVRSPASALIRFRISDAMRAMLAHDRRHVAQAERVMARPDFPSGPPPRASEREADDGGSLDAENADVRR